MNKSILVVDDDRSILKAVSLILDGSYDVRTAENGAGALKLLNDRPSDLTLLDIGLPDTSGIDLLEKIRHAYPEVTVVMVTAVDEVKTVVKALKIGAYDYLVKPIDAQELKLTVKNALENKSLKDKIRRIQQPNVQRYKFDMIGQSVQMKAFACTAEKLAASVSTPVLLLGESGTGKGMLARAIHYGGTIVPGPFVSINCTAIPSELFESELFGYDRGAFTGAKTEGKTGRFEESAGGTIFLDEIGAMSPTIQSKLLGVLEDRVFYKVGGSRPIPISSRIIAATNANLEKAVEQGQFRNDLYYRLNVVKMELPPLRERIDDIIPLTEYFMEFYNRRLNKKFSKLSPGAQKLLLQYAWPGNVRELRNTLERIILLEEGPIVRTRHFQFLASDMEPNGVMGISFSKKKLVYEDVIKSLINEALKRTRGNVIEAANLLRIPPHKIRYRIKKYGLKN
jgi:DNA-binding NtrC family response regulator